MKHYVNYYLNFIEKLNKIISVFLVICFATMLVTLSAQVFSRFVLGSSIVWSEELGRYLMIYLVVLGAAYAIKDDGLISVTAFKTMLKGKARFFIELLIATLNVIFYFIIIYYGFGILEVVTNQFSPGLGMSMKYFYFALPLGGIVMLLNEIAKHLKMIVREEN